MLKLSHPFFFFFTSNLVSPIKGAFELNTQEPFISYQFPTQTAAEHLAHRVTLCGLLPILKGSSDTPS